MNRYPAYTGSDPKLVTEREKEIDVWNTDSDHVLHILKNTIGDAKLIHVVGAETAAQAWKQLAEVKEPRGLTAIVNTMWKLYTTQCPETRSVTDHIAKLHGIMLDCQTLGESISDWTFTTIITKSLPLSWDLWVSAFWASQTIADKDQIQSSNVISRIFEEEQQRRIHKEQQDEVANLAQAHNRGKRTLPKSDSITCNNCKKLGHSAAQCYAKGGGSEGQGP